MADDPTNLTADKLLAAKRRLDAGIAAQREQDIAAGLCICEPCFQNRLTVLFFGQLIGPSRRCWNDPAERWWRDHEERNRAAAPRSGEADG